MNAPVLHQPPELHVGWPDAIPPPALQRRCGDACQRAGLLRVEVGAVSCQRSRHALKSFDDLFHA